MMRVLLLLLLVGALAGSFLAGRFTAPEAVGSPGQRAPRRQGAQGAESAVAKGGDAPAPGAVAEPSIPVEEVDVVAPSLPLDDEGPYPQIRIDFQGFEGERKAWIGVRSMHGGLEESEAEAGDDGIVIFDEQPGVYDVWWLGADGRRLGARVRTEEGRITTLRAVDHRLEAPVPRGLGVLCLEIRSSEGRGLSEVVSVSHDLDSENLKTNGAGHATIALIPGRYSVSVGSHVDEVVVEEGRTTSHRIAHDREGDLVISADRPMGINVVATLDPFEETSHVRREHYPGWCGQVGGAGEPVVVPYLEEGEYGIFLLRCSFGVPLMHVIVDAGKVTRVRCKAPGGGLTLKLIATPAPGAGRIQVCRIVDGCADESTAAQEWVSQIPDPFEAMLMPGRYAVTVSADGFEPASAEFEVSDRVVELSLEPKRAR